ncbi:hypothetical protein [Gordonia sp. FQ]|uniref:hypothetical protein n=1 Tax=Gordonia sp. FQ TaxID=3446634 RepID=UPI003F841F1A
MKVVYLHGVGPDGDADHEWLAALNGSLATLGAEPIDERDVVAPRYAALLGTTGLSVAHPKNTYKEKDDRAARRAFERRQAQVERTIRHFEDVKTFGFHRISGAMVHPIQSAAINAAPIAELKQVKNYLTDEKTRAAVLQRIIDDLPHKDDIILIGHSLGSVIAIDLLDNLPSGVHVQRFITIGSPAGSPVLYQGRARILKRFPYSRVDDWSNFLDPADAVTAGKGLAALFPGAQDFMITGATGHRSPSYLRHPAIATLVDQILNPGKDVVIASSAVVPRLTEDQASTLATIEFANHVTDKIDDDERANRFEDAVSVLRDNYVAELIEQSTGHAIPQEIEELGKGRMPNLPRRWDLAEAIALTVVLANTNLIAPHEIDTGDAALQAIVPFMVQLGYPTGTGKKVQAAVQEVNDHLSGSRWSPSTTTRVAMAAVGVALLAAGPVGVAMAGAAGTAGAAAVTSGLAAFGPGGMAGGMAMLTGLGGTGGMVAAAAATARTGGENLVLDPTSLAIRVATAQALRDVGEPFDDNLWQDIADAETGLAADYNRMETFSDPKSPALKKIDAARTTLTGLQGYMFAHGLVPDDFEAPLRDGSAPQPSGSGKTKTRFQLRRGRDEDD